MNRGVDQVAAGAGGMSSTVERITTTAGSTTGSARQLRTSADALTGTAEELTSLGAGFRLDHPSRAGGAPLSSRGRR